MTPRKPSANAGTPVAKPADTEPVATDPVTPDQLASDGDQVRPGLSEEAPNA